MKFCHYCSRSLNESCFSKNQGNCKECRKIINLKSLKKHDKKQYELRKKHFELEIKKEEMKKLGKKYCLSCHIFKELKYFSKDNSRADGINNKCKECVSKITKRYKKNNREKVNFRKSAYESKRRAIKRDINQIFSDKDIEKVFSKFSNKCFNCGSIESLQVDHHYPLSKGFALTEKNAVLLCINCNSSKNNHSPEKFYTEKQLKELKTKFNIMEVKIA